MHFFEQLYENPEALREFVAAMSGFQGGNFMALVSAFDFSKYRTVADLGGADWFLCCTIAQHHPAVACTTYDLPPVKPLAEARIERSKLQGRVKAENIDIESDPLPAADVITMGNVLHGDDEAIETTVGAEDVRRRHRRWRLHRHREHHRQRAKAEHARPADEPAHADREWEWL